MNQHRLDAIVAPTTGPAWLTDHIVGDRFDGGSSAGPAAIAGYPDITPMGFVSGLPVDLVLRQGVERADAAENCLRLRAGDEAARAAAVRGDTRVDAQARARTQTFRCPSVTDMRERRRSVQLAAQPCTADVSEDPRLVIVGAIY